MSTTKTVQVSKSNVAVLAAEINAAIDGGRDVTINGDHAVRGYTTSATSWQTGSLSYTVAAKKPGTFRQVFVKAGHMVTITSEAPEHHGEAPHAMVKPPKRGKRTSTPTFTPSDSSDAPSAAPTPIKSKDGKHPIEATYKGETGYLSLRISNGQYRYGVTLDESKATRFSPGASAQRHAARAEKAGLKVAA